MASDSRYRTGPHNALQKEPRSELRAEVVPADGQSIVIPDMFDEERIRHDLARFSQAPGILRKYAERARSRFNKVGERALLEHWITYYETGRRLVEARTEMERRRSEWFQLTNEHELKQTEKDAEIAKLQADAEENRLRRDQATYKRTNLERFIEGREPAKPQLSSEQQRRLKRMEIEDKMRELDRLEEEALKGARTKADREPIQNMYADKRVELREQLAKYLV